MPIASAIFPGAERGAILPGEMAETSLTGEIDRFDDLRRDADGMLDASIYHRMSIWARALPQGCDALEIGSGCGAGTVALAWGIQDTGSTARVIAVDRCLGGSRLRYGGFRENLLRLRSTLARHGVQKHVRLLAIDLHEHTYGQVLTALDGYRIGLVVLDADGRLDRDIPRLWPHVANEARFIVDDCVERGIYRPVSPSYPMGGTKFTLTSRILQYLLREEWMRMEFSARNTFFMTASRGCGRDLPSVVEMAISRIRDQVRLEWLRSVAADALDPLRIECPSP